MEIRERERFVLDTSAFTNPETYALLGDSPREAFIRFLAFARTRRGDMEFFMPPSVYEELLRFVGAEDLPPDMELLIRLRPPRRHEIQVRGAFLYELIEEIRNRINKGLRVAETAVREVKGVKDPEATITRLRERYRTALRVGIIDSREDLELVLLALELDAALLSSDTGIFTWAEKLGVRLLHPKGIFTLAASVKEEGAS